MIKKRTIGKSQVIVDSLGLGTNKVGGHNLFKGLNDYEGEKIIRTALDNNISLLDTAYFYGLGQSETIIGNAIKDYDRSKVVIASKAAQDPTNNFQINNHPEFLEKQINDSLKRLKTDYLDIFYVHYPDKETPKDEVVGYLQQLKEQGKIRAIGLSNFSFDQIKEANKNNYVDVVENHYNLVYRKAEQIEFPYFKDHNISFIPYFPLASGLLTGKYNEHTVFSKEDWQLADSNFQGERFESIVNAMKDIETMALEYNTTPADIILSWYMNNPNITSVIPGASNAKQVLKNVKARDIKLNKDTYEKIDQLFNVKEFYI